MNNPFKHQSKVNPQRENGRREISNEVWHALMRAGLAGGEYQVVLTVIDRTWGFNQISTLISLKQFEDATHLTRQGVVKAIKRVEEKHIIVRRKDGTKGTEYLFNKHYDTWITNTSEQGLPSIEETPLPDTSEQGLPSEEEPLPDTSEQGLPSEEAVLDNHRLPDQATTVYQSSEQGLPSTSKLAERGTEPVKKTLKETPKESIKEIYTVWNSLNIITHKKMTDKMKTAVKSALGDYSKEEICQAMSNYNEILNGEDYYWRYKWTLDEFIRRGLEKFMDAEVARQNYREERRHAGKRTEQGRGAGTHRGDTEPSDEPAKKPVRYRE